MDLPVGWKIGGKVERVFDTRTSLKGLNLEVCSAWGSKMQLKGLRAKWSAPNWLLDEFSTRKCLPLHLFRHHHQKLSYRDWCSSKSLKKDEDCLNYVFSFLRRTSFKTASWLSQNWEWHLQVRPQTRLSYFIVILNIYIYTYVYHVVYQFVIFSYTKEWSHIACATSLIKVLLAIITIVNIVTIVTIVKSSNGTLRQNTK